MKWMAFQKAISVDISHTSVDESIKLDAMGMCDVCNMYVRMYVCSYHVLTSFFLSASLPHLPLVLTHAKATRTNMCMYVRTCMDIYKYDVRCIIYLYTHILLYVHT